MIRRCIQDAVLRDLSHRPTRNHIYHYNLLFDISDSDSEDSDSEDSDSEDSDSEDSDSEDSDSEDSDSEDSDSEDSDSEDSDFDYQKIAIQIQKGYQVDLEIDHQEKVSFSLFEKDILPESILYELVLRKNIISILEKILTSSIYLIYLFYILRIHEIPPILWSQQIALIGLFHLIMVYGVLYQI